MQSESSSWTDIVNAVSAILTVALVIVGGGLAIIFNGIFHRLNKLEERDQELTSVQADFKLINARMEDMLEQIKKMENKIDEYNMYKSEVRDSLRNIERQIIDISRP